VWDTPVIVTTIDQLDRETLPAHIAIVMDGNGRWASQRGLPRTAGHEAGEEALFDVVDGAIDLGLRWLTIYAFSTENWRRPAGEVKFLLNFNRKILRGRVDELHERGVRVRFVGRRDRKLPPGVLKDMVAAEKKTASNAGLTINVAFNYGGRAEIVDAVRAVVASGVASDDVDESLIAAHLYAPDVPDPDLVIRTSGEYRLSNFLIWEVAYSEMVFSDVLWPDFRREHLYGAIADFQRRSRRFGGVATS
jgi:undecaprenyl diphosphate synthase